MSQIKHLGKHNQKRCVVLFKKVPGIDDMGLISYHDELPEKYKTPVRLSLESAAGQGAKEFGEALGEVYLPGTEGDLTRNSMLNILHTEGFIRKVPTNQVILTPNARTTLRLDELNAMLDNMETGDDAKEAMRAYDNSRGLKTDQKIVNTTTLNEGKDMGEPDARMPTLQASDMTALTDEDIANNNIAQAKAMKAQAKAAVDEAKRLEEEAYDMVPSMRPKKRGRPAGSKNKGKASVKSPTAEG